jgi:isocitrate lyase
VINRSSNDLPRLSDLPQGRFNGVRRDYGPAEVEALRGTVRVEHTLARLGAQRLWELLEERPYVNALGALTGNQAVQQVKAGLEAI